MTRAPIIPILAVAGVVMDDDPGGTAAYTGNLIVAHRPQHGDFQGVRFPAEELRHLNKLLAKGRNKRPHFMIAGENPY